MGDPMSRSSWEKGRYQGTEEIMALIPPGSTVMLIDDGQWGIRELVAARGRVPCPADYGDGGGPPGDDDVAILECERVRRAGAQFLVVARPAFWWLDYYSEWQRYLVSGFRCLLANDRLCVFDLRQAPSGGRGTVDLSGLLEAARREERHGSRERVRSYAAGDLRAFERRAYSEDGEDGILEEILRRVGRRTRQFVEFGVGSGRYCNCARLVLEEDWQGLFMEVEPASFDRLRRRYLSYPKVKCVQALVGSSNIEALLATHGVPEEFDVLSIDIDGNDYWVWAAIRRWRPRIVVIEYNGGYPSGEKWVMPEDPNRQGDESPGLGASLASLEDLGGQKGYRLVATTSERVNAFFVRQDLATDGRFPGPAAYDE